MANKQVSCCFIMTFSYKPNVYVKIAKNVFILIHNFSSYPKNKSETTLTVVYDLRERLREHKLILVNVDKRFYEIYRHNI